MKNILFKIKNELYKAKEQGWEDEDNIYIKLSIEEWKKLIKYVEKGE